ncbi:disks large-associated protein 5-like [Spea bombifrons]|uniref:disks large-associated protein 5-like n=1 Tax=Spea bombifrons TaxID=233779 RepID=UPI00234B890A|nr:disks large-associated protein 5-like [Spea bombifrons]
MDTRSQFAGRYKKDLSTETLRAKVARRKSITQKENRHKEFRKGRGLALADGKAQPRRERHGSRVVSKPKQQMSKERLEMLQRFKEEKLLRKLKDQREKAAKGVFKCGLYKPDVMLLPPAPPQKAVKVKAKDQGDEKWEDVPSVDVQIAQLSKRATIPISEVAGLKDPMDKRAETSCRRVFQSSGFQRKVTLSSASVAKAQGIWLQSLESSLSDAMDEGLSKLFKNLKLANSFLVEAAEESLKLLACNMGLSSVARRALWLRSWAADTASKSTLCDLPFERTKLFGSPLEELIRHITVCTVETNTTTSPQRKECVTEQYSCTSAQQSPPSQTIISDALQENKELEQLEEPQHDVPYFRNILKSETERLFILSTEWGKKVDGDIPEDAKDLIRTTVGQTRLLITERFKQFEGLVDNCEFKRGEKETTCTDLDGFWDMIYFQVEDVGKKFVNLGKLEENSWQQNTVQTKKAVKKRIVSAPKQSQGDNGRAAARGRLAAIKAALKDKGKPTEPVAEVASDLPKQLELVVFDAGFFRIESPAKPKKDVKINRRSSQTPNASKSITKTSRIHVTGLFLEDDVECLEIKGSKSPVGRVLFTADKESTLNTEESCKSTDFSDNKDDSSQAIPEKYLVPTECIDLEFGDSSAAKPSECNLDAILTTNASFVDDVFITSPGKTVEEISIHSPFKDLLGEFADADCKIDSDGIPLRGSCSPSNTVE